MLLTAVDTQLKEKHSTEHIVVVFFTCSVLISFQLFMFLRGFDSWNLSQKKSCIENQTREFLLSHPLAATSHRHFHCFERKTVLTLDASLKIFLRKRNSELRLTVSCCGETSLYVNMSTCQLFSKQSAAALISEEMHRSYTSYARRATESQTIKRKGHRFYRF